MYYYFVSYSLFSHLLFYVRILREAKVKQRLDLFEVLRSGDCARVKAFIGDSLDNVKVSKNTPLSAAAGQRATVMRELIASQPLLHCCVGESSSRSAGSGTSKSTVEGRVAIAQYLLGIQKYPINLSVTDDDGRTALHLAAKKEDSTMLKLFLSAREESHERKSQLDINARCGKSGWTFLHYAAGQGDIASVRLLMEAGATLVVHATSGKAVSPLDLVKTRLQNAGHFSAVHIANLQLVAKELSEAVRAQEKVKAQKEAERQLKDEKLEAARKKLAEREDKERELLERKQKQLKDRQEKDKARDLEGEVCKKSKIPPTPVAVPTAKAGNAVISPANLAVLPSNVVSQSASPCVPSSPSLVPADNDSKSKKKKKKDKRNDEEDQPAPPASSGGKVTVVDVASRDELVDHLLAMGFQEADCLSAISLYGKDVDKALSWLCDRPAVPEVSSSSSSTAGVKPGAVSDDSASASQIEAVRLQKEKDHKEELRRVNRAWNMKAEDEKKRVSILSVLFINLFLMIHFLVAPVRDLFSSSFPLAPSRDRVSRVVFYQFSNRIISTQDRATLLLIL